MINIIFNLKSIFLDKKTLNKNHLKKVIKLEKKVNELKQKSKNYLIAAQKDAEIMKNKHNY